MNKYIIPAIIAVLILIFIAYNFTNDVPTQGAEAVDSTIAVSGEPFDFGDIDIFGGKVSTTYTLKNEGEQDVNILQAQTSCMCTEGEIDGLVFGMHSSDGTVVVIPAGEEKTLTATFDPLAHGPNGTGKITRELMLKTNSTVTPEIKVTFSGNVIKN